MCASNFTHSTTIKPSAITGQWQLAVEQMSTDKMVYSTAVSIGDATRLESYRLWKVLILKIALKKG